MVSFSEADQFKLHLSVVAVTRNDDHGGNMLGRMQYFVDGFIAQCSQHQLNAELILVEWNPPPDRPPLEEALTWPEDFGSAQVRIITVPPEVHARFAHSADLPVFQMIGKNVGIRRARGLYVLATNIDILFDDELVRYLRDRLNPGTIVRADRYDVPADLPKNKPFEQVLADCRKRFYQVNTRYGIFDMTERRLLGMSTGLEAAVMSFICGFPIMGIHLCNPWRGWVRTIAGFVAIAFGILAGIANRAIQIIIRNIRYIAPLRRLPVRSYYLLRRIVVRVWLLMKRLVRFGLGVIDSLVALFSLTMITSTATSQRRNAILRFRRSRWLHTNACGDFTLMTRDDWFRLRGYPEWPIFSWHLDSVLLFAANAQDIQEVALGVRYRIYHIDHSIGSGWSPQGAVQLFARLDKKGIPYLSNDDLLRLQKTFAANPRAAIINDENWGLIELPVMEREIMPGGANGIDKQQYAVTSP